MRRILLALGVVALVAAVVVGLTQTTGSNSKPVSRALTPAQTRAALAGSPPALAALHRQGGAMLGGGPGAIRTRLRALRGHPIVVNKWASWCGPCRFEFPFLQRAAVTYGRRVAFLGVDSADNREDALEFLREFPVPYPSYEDPDIKIATRLELAPGRFPVTAFYDREGRQVIVHQGGYRDQADLDADIRRYALGR
jgi:cytochrome c biogenesis protein CcmG, thiol:disulfide interchange protein DsbE